MMTERLTRIEAQLEALMTLLLEGGAHRELIYPAASIAKALGCHTRTVAKWSKHPTHPLPTIHMGHGLATTRSLISTWVLERWGEEKASPHVGKLFGRSRRAEGQSRKIRVRLQGWGAGEAKAPAPEAEAEEI
jgi:hypothetical protein